MSLPYNANLVNRARKMRREMTDYEFKLWSDFLSQYPIKFRRQKVIDIYIVDFFCYQADLVIEIDGSQHYDDTSLMYDEKRTRRLNELGLTVLRFTNSEISNNFQGVCDTIDMEVKKRI